MSIRLLKMLAVCLVFMSVTSCISTPPARSYTDPDALLALLSNDTEPYFLIDVRTKDEYTSGHIPTAVNIPYDVIADNLPTKDTAALIIVYCQSGARSAKAAVTLQKLGYTRVVEFGSIKRWKWAILDSSDPGECPCRNL
jgi:phage shock protein E